MYTILNPSGDPLIDVKVWEANGVMSQRTPDGVTEIITRMMSSPSTRAAGNPKRAAKNFVMCVIILQFKIDLSVFIPQAEAILEARRALSDEKAKLDVSQVTVAISDNAKRNLVGMFSNKTRALNNIYWTADIAKRLDQPPVSGIALHAHLRS